MGNCRDCRHWQRGEFDTEDERFCELTQRDGTGRLVHPGTLAQADSGDPYCGLRLTTAPDFGCVQFEAVGELRAKGDG